MIYSVWSYQNNGIVLCKKKKTKKLDKFLVSHPTTSSPPRRYPQPSTHPSLLEAETLLCASLAPSKCTVFLENYSRKFASLWGDAALAAAVNVHLHSGICTCVFRGWCSCLWRVFELLDLSECLVMLKSRCAFIKTNESEGKMWPLDVSKMGVQGWISNLWKTQRENTICLHLMLSEATFWLALK